MANVLPPLAPFSDTRPVTGLSQLHSSVPDHQLPPSGAIDGHYESAILRTID